MKKIITTFFILFSFCIYSQSILFKTGLNMTTYDYTNSKNKTNSNIESSTGSFYEIGYSIPIKTGTYGTRRGSRSRNAKLYATSSLTLNQYNATGGNNVDSYSWDTNYLGWNNYLNYSLLDQNKFIDFSIKGGLGISTIIHGKQKIGGEIFDLKFNNEFNGLWISPVIGFNIKYDLFEETYLSLGYDFSKVISTNKNSESLSFFNKQLSFGILINIR